MSRVYLFYVLFLPIMAIASNDPNTSIATTSDLGHVAQNLMEPVGILSDFVQTACFIIGISFLFASIIKYKEHRRNPLMVPIGTVVFLLIAGILLILLPFLSLITDSGLRYSLF